jgi:hypothetical protein
MSDENEEIIENSKEEPLEENQLEDKRGKGRPPLPKPERVYKKKEVDPNKPKRVQTEAQLASFAKAREVLAKKRAERLAEKEKILKQADEIRIENEVKAKKKIEDQLVSKAVAVKKAQIKKEKMIQEVLSESDDEDLAKEVKEFVARRKVEKKMSKPKTVTKVSPPEPPKPLFRFV